MVKGRFWMWTALFAGVIALGLGVFSWLYDGDDSFQRASMFYNGATACFALAIFCKK